MIELRFHRELYAGTAVDEAVKVYERFGTFELDQQPEHWVVRIGAATEERAGKLARELANYALGLTIRNRTPA